MNNNYNTGHVGWSPDFKSTPQLPRLRSLSPSDAADGSAGWQPIETAPKDGSEIIVYCPPAHGLNHMASVCAWHEDAGFCVCELREPAFWIPLPNKELDHP